MKIRKKIIACVIAIAIAITSTGVSLYTYAFDKNVNINSALLDSILNDRYWVIETLVNGDISNNPYSVVNVYSTNETIKDEVLYNYQTDAAFKALVDAMEIYANSGEYLSGFADDIITTFMSWFSTEDSDVALSEIDDIMASTEELKYESIINEVLKMDYTSSWGDSLFEENMDLESLQQQADVLKKLSDYQQGLKDITGLTGTNSSIVIYDPYNIQDASFEIDMEDYVGHFLDAYEQDMEAYLTNTVTIPSVEGNDALKKKILATSALAMVFTYERVSANSDTPSQEFFREMFFEDTMSVLNGAGKVLNIGSTAMDYAILLEALQAQKSTTVDTMNRIANSTSNTDLQKVMNNYAELFNSQGDKKTLAYETITNYMRNQSTVTNLVTKQAANGAVKMIESAVSKYGGAKGLVLQCSISDALSKASAIASLTTWVANQTTGIENTAKKIYVLKYLDKIINEVVALYSKDIKAYSSNKTEVNAEKVLNDLEFLKQLRLYGEKTAYGSMCAQMESWIGLLLGGGDTLEYLDNRYQASIDTFLGCSIAPITNNIFELSAGDVLNINSTTLSNGKTVTTASLQKSTGKFVNFAEADLRLLGGIDLNGATVNILNAPNGVYLPIINNDTAGSTINIYCDNVAIGNITNTNTLNINFNKNTASLQITDRITNSSTLNITNSASTSSVEIWEYKNTGTINANGLTLNVKATATNNGTINGSVNICGDGSQIYSNGYYEYGTQTMLGSGNYSTLMFNNYTKNGVYISGTQTITSSLSNSRTRIKNGKNLIATGNCSINNGFYGAVTLKDYTSPAYTKFKGDVFISGTVTFPYSAIFNEGLCLTSSCTSLTLPSDVTVNGDLSVNGGKISGNGIFNIKGDLNVTTSNFTASNLNFSGLTPQSATLSSAITVGTLNNSNTSLSGVSINSTVNVTDTLLCTDDTKFLNGNNIVLTSTANINSDIINGSITADGWTCNRDKLEVKGTLKTLNNVSLPNDLVVEKFEQQNGTATIGDNAIVNDFEQVSGTVTFGNNTIIIDDDFNQLGTLNIGNDSTITLEKATASKNITLGENTVLNCKTTFVNTGTISGTGTVILNDDSKLNSLNGGFYEFNNGDITASGSVVADIFKFNSNIPQQYSGPSSSTIGVLEVNNTSKTGFILSSVIHVTENFINNANRIDDIRNIYLDYADGKQYAQETYDEQTVIDGNLTFNDYTIVVITDDIQVNGNVTIPSTSRLIVSNGGILNSKGSITANSATVNVLEGGSIRIGDYFNSSSSTINVDGNLTIVGDSKLTSSTIGGNGTFNFMGDVNSSSCTWNKPNVSFCGKTPQTVSGSAISVNNLTINNTSKSGITFSTTVNYYGEYTEDTSVINGSNYIVSKV